jgi:hypothetical protein
MPQPRSARVRVCRQDHTLLHLQAKKALKLQARQLEEHAALGAGQKLHRLAAPRRDRRARRREVHRREEVPGRELGLRGITGSQLARRQRSHKNKNNRYLLG